VQKIVLLLLVAVSAFFEFSDVFRYLEFGTKTLFYNLPLFACDLNIFILPLAILRTGRKDTLNKFVLYYVTTGPCFTLLIPEISENVYTWYSNEILGTFLPHSIYIIVAILYLKFNHIRCSPSKPYKVLSCMLVILTIVHIFNLILIFTDIFPDANYMFTGKAPPMAWANILANALGYRNKYIRSYFLLVLGYTLLTTIAFLIHKCLDKNFTHVSCA
jgi:hypothetical protein